MNRASRKAIPCGFFSVAYVAFTVVVARSMACTDFFAHSETYAVLPVGSCGSNHTPNVSRSPMSTVPSFCPYVASPAIENTWSTGASTAVTTSFVPSGEAATPDT
ncbi:MAG: hypothetical protein QM820_48700 [Minicystis sp.]